jgi:hypothetical protein
VKPPLSYASQVSLWTRWLGYRMPHYDAMEAAVARTLTNGGRATVRVGFNPRTGMPADAHVALFTRTRETPDPAAAIAAAVEYKPAGMVLHQVITPEVSAHEHAPQDPRPRDVARAVVAATRTVRDVRRAREDPRVPATTLDRLEQRARAATSHARAEVERAITDGLLLRRGFLLVPTMIVKAEMLDSWVSYVAALGTRAAFASGSMSESLTWRPSGIAVCRSCTAVFTPRRRSSSEYCSLCSKRPAARTVVGQMPFAKGRSQTVRVPRLAGHTIIGWKTTTIGVCTECGNPFHGRRDAIVCRTCSNRVRQRRHRSRDD